MRLMDKLQRNYSLEEIDEVANALINTIDSKVILLYGDMGVGKTTLIRAIAKQLGCEDDVQSPTYSIVNEYIMKDDTLYHFDLYRIEDLEEAYNFGIEEYLYSGSWVIIEWPKIISSIVPENAQHISITIGENGLRKLTL